MAVLRVCALMALSVSLVFGCGNGGPVAPQMDEEEMPIDMLTPAYYTVTLQDPLRAEIDNFLSTAHDEQFHHPLSDTQGQHPAFSVPSNGLFGARKGSGAIAQHHPAVDLHVGNRETSVEVFAAHDGRVTAVRDAPKYRQYLAVQKDVVDENGMLTGKLVTIYAHLDLDLDENDGLSLDGQDVRAGDLLSTHLYSGTVGGPHLHFEIRYYRPDDSGNETYYGLGPPVGGDDLSVPSAGNWSHGFWNPEVGYGFGHPLSHGLTW